MHPLGGNRRAILASPLSCLRRKWLVRWIPDLVCANTFVADGADGTTAPVDAATVGERGKMDEWAGSLR